MTRWRLFICAMLTLLAGCQVVVPPGNVQPAEIPPTQFLRPTRDSITNTWIAAWVDPDNFAQ